MLDFKRVIKMRALDRIQHPQLQYRKSKGYKQADVKY